MMFRTGVGCLAVALGLLAAPVGSQAVMVGLGTAQLTDESDLALIGQVESTTCAWSGDGKAILTYAVVSVDEGLKGEAPDRLITVVTQGGRVGKLGMRVSDSEPLAAGEKVLLFLKPEGGPHAMAAPGTKAAYRLVGKAQGKYTIGPDGVARKKGFSLAEGQQEVDNDIPVAELVQKIRRRAGQ